MPPSLSCTLRRSTCSSAEGVLLRGTLLGRMGLGLGGVRLGLRYEVGLVRMGRLSPSEANQGTARKSGHSEQKPGRSLGFHGRQTAGLA